MSLASISIADTKIKFRFGEPYNSEAANLQMGVNDRGAYRGALVKETSPDPSKAIEICTEDGDSVVIHRDASTGYCVVVRETSDVQLSMSGQFDDGGAIPAGGKTWYVYMTASYTLDSESSGEWCVALTIPTNAVVLARIDMPAGATEIAQEYIRTDGTNRDKVVKYHDMTVKKSVEVKIGDGGARFQIPGKVLFKPTSDSVDRVRLLQGITGANSSKKLVMTTTGAALNGYRWYPSEDSETALYSDDMDEDGCYSDPWVEVVQDDGSEAGTFDSKFGCLYSTIEPIDEIVPKDSGAGFATAQHVFDILSPVLTASPSSLSKGTLLSQLSSILTLINGRVQTKNQLEQDTIQLLWRSHDVEDDAVTEEVVSIYYDTSNIFVLRGGYYNSPEVPAGVHQYISNGEVNGACAARFDLSNTVLYFFYSDNVGGAATINLSVSGTWDTKERADFGTSEYDGKTLGTRTKSFYNVVSEVFYASTEISDPQKKTGYRSSKFNAVPTSPRRFLPLYDFAEMGSGLWWGEDGQMAMVHNATFDPEAGSDGDWVLRSADVDSAYVFTFGSSVSYKWYSAALDLATWDTGEVFNDNNVRNHRSLDGASGDDVLSCETVRGGKEKIWFRESGVDITPGDSDSSIVAFNYRNYRPEIGEGSATAEWTWVTDLITDDFEVTVAPMFLDGWGGYLLIWVTSTRSTTSSYNVRGTLEVEDQFPLSMLEE